MLDLQTTMDIISLPFYSFSYVALCVSFRMMLIIISLIVLINSQRVHSKVIKINTTGGSDNTACCVDGECVCSSLSTALHHMTSNSVIIITSQSVTLEGHIKMRSSELKNITITGNGATIMCNNSGGVYCEYCSSCMIVSFSIQMLQLFLYWKPSEQLYFKIAILHRTAYKIHV